MEYNNSYDENYYHNCCGSISYEEPEHWTEFFGNVADNIIKKFNPKTVLDVGCAMGYLVTALRDRGVEAYGIDISEYAISKVRDDIKPYCKVASILTSYPDQFPTHFDLVTTIEVIEHLYEQDSDTFIKNICNLSDNIVFSSTPYDKEEKTHYNVQEAEYWCKKFAKQGYFKDFNQSVTYICDWAMVLRKTSDIESIIHNYEHNYQTLRENLRRLINHPENFTGALYLNNGSGFSENNKLVCNYLHENSKISFSVDIPQGTKSVRFDPCESCCIISDLIIRINGENYYKFTSNVFEKENIYISTNADPWFEIEINLTGQCKIDVCAEIFIVGESVILGLINSFDEAQNDVRNLNAEIKMLNNENEQLKQQVITNQNNYNAIINSRFWRITKPIRKFNGLMKKVVKSNPVTRNFAKGLLSLKRVGLKGTLRKINTKIKIKQSTKHNSDTFVLAKKDIMLQRNTKFNKTIKFSILVPLYNTPEKLLNEMIESVINQTYMNWELCLADGSDEYHNFVEDVCKKYIEKDNRIKYKKLEKNLGISDNTNECIKMSTGDYIALFDHDDLLYPSALFENAKVIDELNADVIYSDEDKVNEKGKHSSPFFKPDWSPDLLYAQMYICHFLVFRKALLEKSDGFNSEFDGSQDYDLMLRLSECTEKIHHIPKVLYSWRETENSTSVNPDSKPYANSSGLRALNSHLKRKYGTSSRAEEAEFTFVYNARFDTLKNSPKVSIIMPMKDNWQLSDNCIKSILDESTYKNYEILILDNNSTEPQTFEWFKTITELDTRIKVIPAKFEFNWSKLNNFGMEYATGEVYIFLNNDIVIISEDWIERLCENALREDISVVGGLLLYEDNTIQHAGVVVGMGGWADHIFKGMQAVHFGSPYVSPMVTRNVLAVTGACMAISKNTIDKIGKFDDEFIICGSDVEICIRGYEKGLRNLYLPSVKLYHLESKSRDSYIPKIDFEKSYETYAKYREGIDPYFNKNLDINSVIPREKVIM